MKNRKIASIVLLKNASKFGRIIVLTGARQTGKTTLVRNLFPDYEYISIEDPTMRGQYVKLTATQWKTMFPTAILDEVQKEPTLIESIKSVYDQWLEPRYILLGSSQLLLLEKVKESLAGRCSIIEIFPLTIPELCTNNWDKNSEDSIFQRIVKEEEPIEFLPSFLFDKNMDKKQLAWEQYLKFGAYPAVSDPDLSEEEKHEWLRDYVRTYLERDIRDLASFRELEPFVKLQRYLAINTGNLINASAIATQLGLSAKTVQRYIGYFELSYQTISLPAWSRNQTKRLVKTPKIHYLDNGIVQTILQKRGGITGNEFESLVIAEIYKQTKTIQKTVGFYHLRTHDGKEVDLLIELQNGYIAIEVKMKNVIDKQDIKHLINLGEMLDKPLLHAILLSNDTETKRFGDYIIALNAAYFLG